MINQSSCLSLEVPTGWGALMGFLKFFVVIHYEISAW
jgi:hypothetical protein